MVSKITVQSLWVGNKLSRMEIYSIKSFLNLDLNFIFIHMKKYKEYPKEL